VNEFELNCPEIFDPLARIDEAMQRLSPVPVVSDHEYYEWQVRKVGREVNYLREVTFSDSSISVEIPFSKPIRLKRIEQWFNSTNSRTSNIRMHSHSNPDGYNELDNKTNVTDTTNFVDLGVGFVYLTATKIVFNFSDFTSDDKVNIEVQLEELV
jgi:hypothetical protein